MPGVFVFLLLNVFVSLCIDATGVFSFLLCECFPQPMTRCRRRFLFYVFLSLCPDAAGVFCFLVVLMSFFQSEGQFVKARAKVTLFEITILMGDFIACEIC